MRRLAVLVASDPEAAGELWSLVDQVEVDEAYSLAMGEREPFVVPGGRGPVNLATVAQRAFGLVPEVHPV